MSGLIVSVHIPKTAGSRFRASLSARYGRAAALYYGPDDPRTHPAARRRQEEFDDEMVRDLERAGIAVLHGHFRAASFAAAIPDPARYWVWLREPIERTVSHYHFVAKAGQASNPLNRAIDDEGLTVEAFAARPRIAALQSNHCAPFGLEEFGFVGVSELFAPLVATLGLSDPGGTGNANHDKPMAGPAERRALAALLTDDLALYSQAMELTMRRMGRGQRAGRARWLPRLLAPARSVATAEGD